MKASDIMTKEVISVKPQTPVKEVAEILITKRISGVPVVDDEKHITGIITEADLIFRDKKPHIPTLVTLFGGVIYLERPKHLEEELKKMLGAKASDIMTKDVVTVEEDASLEDIATLMSTKRFHLLPVVKDNKLIGIISKADIVKTIARE